MKQSSSICRVAWVLLVAGLGITATAPQLNGQTAAGKGAARPRSDRAQPERAQRTANAAARQQAEAPAAGRTGGSVYQQRTADRRNAEPAEQPAPQYVPEPRVPLWMPIQQKHQDYINKLLAAWEAQSAGVHRYECQFTRWKYDLGFDATGELVEDVRGFEAASEISKGIIKFNQPDKALFKVIDKSDVNLLNLNEKKSVGPWQFDPETKDYKEVTLEEAGEYWICDGEHFFEFNYRQQALRKIPIPEEARGEAMARGPLPFLFKAKANEISNRFWLRIVTPKDETEAHHLEATPKTMQDASQFGRVIIILDSKEFLPKALIIYPVGSRAPDDRPPPPPNESPVNEPPVRELYIFDERKVNPVLDRIKEGIWMRSFYEPKVPSGWQLVEEPMVGGVATDPEAPEGFEGLDEGIAPAAATESIRQPKRR